MTKPKGIFFCAEESWHRVYSPEHRAAIAGLIDIPPFLVTRKNWEQHRDTLAKVEIVVSSWGGPVLDEELLAAMPALKIYFYGAGTINGLMSDAAWERGIRITNAASANAISVAEFSLAQIIFSLKRGWFYMQEAKKPASQLWGRNKEVPGLYGSRIGLVSLGYIARALCRLLRHFDVEVVAYCPFTNPDEAAKIGVRLVSLEYIFSECDVVSIHTPSKDETRSMIGTALLERMKLNSTLINTARGDIINQAELISFLRTRPDVYACIDVTDPEPPPPDCGLLDLPNVVLTPHLAGSMHRESYRIGQCILSDLERYLAGHELAYEITCDTAGRFA